MDILPNWRMHARASGTADGSPLRDRIVVVGLVLLAHATVFAGYWMQPEAPSVQVSEMSVSFASTQPQAEPAPQPKPKPLPRVAEPEPAEKPVVKEEAQVQQNAAPPQDAAPPSPVVLDAEPDYKADYLNNPRPPYPIVARRMGYQGKVVLEVEVLAEGRAGDIKLRQSSGYEILDNAAIQTVRTWRFTPANRLGKPVTQRFLVPIRFSLEDSKA